jgi:hypothetical protein
LSYAPSLYFAGFFHSSAKVISHLYQLFYICLTVKSIGDAQTVANEHSSVLIDLSNKHDVFFGIYLPAVFQTSRISCIGFLWLWSFAVGIVIYEELEQYLYAKNL